MDFILKTKRFTPYNASMVVKKLRKKTGGSVFLNHEFRLYRSNEKEVKVNINLFLLPGLDGEDCQSKQFDNWADLVRFYKRVMWCGDA